MGAETLLAVRNALEEILNQYREKRTGGQYKNALSVLGEDKAWQRGRTLSARKLYILIDCNDGGEGYSVPCFLALHKIFAEMEKKCFQGKISML